MGSRMIGIRVGSRLLAVVAAVAGYLLGATRLLPVAPADLALLVFLVVLGILLVPRARDDVPLLVAAVSGAHRPADPQDAWREVRHELQRSRRLGAPMSIVRLDGAAPSVGPIAELTREIDTVWPDGDGVCVLLPATGRAAADEFVSRLRADVGPARAALAHRATFPDDALTGEALFAIAHGRPMPAPGTLANGLPAATSTTTTALAERTEIAGSYARDTDR